MPSTRNPSVAVLEIVSRHTMYLGFVTPCTRRSSALGAVGSTCTIFSYMSFRNCKENKAIYLRVKIKAKVIQLQLCFIDQSLMIHFIISGY